MKIEYWFEALPLGATMWHKLKVDFPGISGFLVAIGPEEDIEVALKKLMEEYLEKGYEIKEKGRNLAA